MVRSSLNFVHPRTRNGRLRIGYLSANFYNHAVSQLMQALFGLHDRKELEIFAKHGGYTPMEAIVAATRDNAYAVGLEGQVGELAPGKLADIIVLNKDPIADITVLQGGKHLAWVIKDGKVVDLDRRDEMLTFQQAAE